MAICASFADIQPYMPKGSEVWGAVPNFFQGFLQPLGGGVSKHQPWGAKPKKIISEHCQILPSEGGKIWLGGGL